MRRRTNAPVSGRELFAAVQDLLRMSSSWFDAGVSQPVVHLPFGLVACEPVSFLNSADKLFGTTLNLVEVVIGELSPLLPNTTLDLRPLTFEGVFVHCFLR
jgi:hypothetical protein